MVISIIIITNQLGIGILFICFFLGLLIGIPSGMIYEDATDTIKIRDARREGDK